MGTVTRPERWQQRHDAGAQPSAPAHRPVVSVGAWIMLAAVVAPIATAAVLIPWRSQLDTADTALFLVVVIVAVASTGRRMAAATAALVSGTLLRLLPDPPVRVVPDHQPLRLHHRDLAAGGGSGRR